MEKLIKIENPFHERIVKAYGMFSYSFFDMINKPCTISNGFTIFTTNLIVEKEGCKGQAWRDIYFIRPNRSSRWFCFPTLLCAVDFCNAHKNNHSDSYWLKHFIKLYSYELSCTLVMSTIVPSLYFTPVSFDDDLPF